MVHAAHGFAAALLVVFALWLAPARAAEPPAAEIGVDDLEALAATIENDAERQKLLATLRGLIEVRKAAGEPPPKRLSRRLFEFADGAAEAGDAALDRAAAYVRSLPALYDRAKGALAVPGAPAVDGAGLRVFAIVLGVAWFAELVVWLALATKRRRDEARARQGRGQRVRAIGSRVLVDLLPLAVFAGAAYAAFVVLQPPRTVGLVGLNFLLAYVAARGVLVLARTVLAPGVPALRVVAAGDEAADHLYAWTRRIVYVAVVGAFLIETVAVLDLPQSAITGLFRVLGLVLVVLGIVFVLRSRRHLGRTLIDRSARSGDGPLMRSLVHAAAAFWHVPAIAGLIGIYVSWWRQADDGLTFLIRGSVGSVVVVAVGWALFAGSNRALDRVRAVCEAHRDSRRLTRAADRYLPPAHGITRIAIVVAVAAGLLQVWNVPVWSWLETSFGARSASALASIAIVVLIAVLAWELTSAAIEGYLAESRDGKIGRSARMRTLLPLMRKVILVFLSVVVVMIVLSEIGVDIGPLLAGAGVVGLAIGFGAQKLVQDVITGFFLLVEDALAVGDVVTVAGTGGLVEELSVRSIRLRDLSGSLHTIPFSSVDTVTNMTRDFSYFLIDVGVAYREDTDRVGDICRRIVDEMRSESAFAPFILEPLEVLGVERFTDSAVIVRARIKTVPLQQWTVGREFNRRMKKRFDEAGIEMPFPHRTIYFGVDRDGTAPPVHVRMQEADARGSGGTGAAAPPTTTEETGERAASRPAGERPPNPTRIEEG
jgi:small conductance mechanosensitive channel